MPGPGPAPTIYNNIVGKQLKENLGGTGRYGISVMSGTWGTRTAAVSRKLFVICLSGSSRCVFVQRIFDIFQ